MILFPLFVSQSSALQGTPFWTTSLEGVRCSLCRDSRCARLLNELSSGLPLASLCVRERVGVRGRWAQLLLWMTRNLRRATKMTLFSWIYRTREGFTFLLHFGYTLTSLRNTRKVSQCRQEFSNKNCSVNKRCEMLMYRLLFGREIRSTIIRNGVRGLLRSTIDGWALRCLFDEGVGESGSQWKY